MDSQVMARMASLKQADEFHERWQITCVFGKKSG